MDKGYEDSEVDDLFMEKWLLTNTLGRESTWHPAHKFKKRKKKTVFFHENVSFTSVFKDLGWSSEERLVGLWSHGEHDLSWGCAEKQNSLEQR